MNNLFKAATVAVFLMLSCSADAQDNLKPQAVNWSDYPQLPTDMGTVEEIWIFDDILFNMPNTVEDSAFYVMYNKQLPKARLAGFVIGCNQSTFYILIDYGQQNWKWAAFPVSHHDMSVFIRHLQLNFPMMKMRYIGHDKQN